MRKTDSVSSKFSRNSIDKTGISENTGNKKLSSPESRNLDHNVGDMPASESATLCKATAQSTTAQNEHSTATHNAGLLNDKLSSSCNLAIDKQVHNNLSPDLSTTLCSGGFAKGLANNENHEFRKLGNSNGNTALQQCVVAELEKYFAMLEGHPPNDLYKLVITQVETALFGFVLEACGNNQSRAAEYLGVSRGTLRNRIVDLSLD